MVEFFAESLSMRIGIKNSKASQKPISYLESKSPARFQWMVSS